MLCLWYRDVGARIYDPISIVYAYENVSVLKIDTYLVFTKSVMETYLEIVIVAAL